MSAPSVHFHLLGRVPLEACLSLQSRLVYQLPSLPAPRAHVIFCEHDGWITIGRSGSWGHIHLSPRRLQQLGLRVWWVPRGGGCLVHTPGQLAGYVSLPLQRFGLTVGQAVRWLHGAVAAALHERGVPVTSPQGSLLLYGRTGPLAAIVPTFRQGVSCYGFYLNVNPWMLPFRRVVLGPAGREPDQTMSSLATERPSAAKMAAVREALVRHLADALQVPNYYVHTGHPDLPSPATQAQESAG